MVYLSKSKKIELFKSKKSVILFLLGLILVFILAFYFQLRREEKLKNSKEVKAIIVSRSEAINGGALIRFKANSKLVKVQLKSGSYKFAKPGDTILIRYAIEDPELVKVVDRYYMKKYHYLR